MDIRGYKKFLDLRKQVADAYGTFNVNDQGTIFIDCEKVGLKMEIYKHGEYQITYYEGVNSENLNGTEITNIRARGNVLDKAMKYIHYQRISKKIKENSTC